MFMTVEIDKLNSRLLKNFYPPRQLAAGFVFTVTYSTSCLIFFLFKNTFSHKRLLTTNCIIFQNNKIESVFPKNVI